MTFDEDLLILPIGKIQFLMMSVTKCIQETCIKRINFLKNIINHDFNSMSVKDNDILKVGNKTLRFISVPHLHWPDTMYTYIEEDKTLITCDSFGSHYCCDDIVLSKVTDNEGYMRATKYYFDNIIGPYKPHMLKALDKIKDLDIQIDKIDNYVEQVLYYSRSNEVGKDYIIKEVSIEDVVKRNYSDDSIS